MSTRFFLVLFVAALIAKPAKAELPAVPADLGSSFTGILQMVEGLALSGGNLSGLAMGGCIPTVMPVALNLVDVHFTSSAVCPIDGDVRLGILPITASVHLVFSNVPYLQQLDADFTATVRFIWGSGLVTTWSLTDGHLAFRLLPTLPLMDWDLTGGGTRTRAFGKGVTISSRINFFDQSTGAGQTLVRSLTRRFFQVSNDQSQVCTLAGATKDSVTSGTMSACHAVGH